MTSTRTVAAARRVQDQPWQEERMSHDKPQTGQKHRSPWSDDLNPDHMAGPNLGVPGTTNGETRTAADIDELVEELLDFSMAELRQIPVLRPGARLQQGATYLDLRDPQGEAFTATGDLTVEDDDWYVPESGTPHPFWNRLLGLSEPQRLH
jgi:hypothetical protein